MTEIDFEMHSVPKLSDPILIAAFKGLFDVGEAATAAIDWLSMTHAGKPAASLDPECLFDFQETRPLIQLGANGTREIHWPTNNLLWAKTGDSLPDIVLLSGVEPNLRWRSFGETLLGIADTLGVRKVVTLGATLAMVPHTRALPVSASTSDEALAEQLGIALPSYEGPTGIVGLLHQLLAEAHIPAISLRVSVPHYVPGNPSPKATAAILAELERLCELPTEHSGLAHDIRDWESQIHLALSNDEEVREYVADLERKFDAEPAIMFDGGDMADEIERFLRNQDGD